MGRTKEEKLTTTPPKRPTRGVSLQVTTTPRFEEEKMTSDVDDLVRRRLQWQAMP
jgi:hypothetical protein